ncbi:MAG: DMT family transporter [Clostridia bacterium]
MDQKKFGILILIVSAMSFGTLGLWGKLAYNVGLTPLQLLAARFTFSSIILWIVGIVFFRKKLKITKNQLLFLFIQGGFLYTITSYAFFLSLQSLKVSLATILFFLHPIYTYFIIAFIVKKKVLLKKWIALLISLAGIIMIVDVASLSMNTSTIGMVYAILAGLCYSIFTVNNDVNNNEISSFISTLYIITFSAVVVNILAGLQFERWLSFTTPQIGVVVGISLIGTILGILGYVIGIRLVGATTASVLSVFEPISGVILAFLFLDESIIPIQLLGMNIVLIAVYLIVTERKIIRKN